MKYILLAVVSILTLAAISLLVVDIVGTSDPEAETSSTSQPQIEPKNEAESHGEPIPALNALPDFNSKQASESVKDSSTALLIEPQEDLGLEQQELAETQGCTSTFEQSVLGIMAEPQNCKRHEECQLKTMKPECGTFIVSKSNGIKIDDWFKKHSASCSLSKTDCSIPVDLDKFQALCIKQQCVKSKVIELKTDPKKFSIDSY